MFLNIHGVSRGMVCDQGEVELVGGATNTHCMRVVVQRPEDILPQYAVYACPSLMNQPVILHMHTHA